MWVGKDIAMYLAERWVLTWDSFQNFKVNWNRVPVGPLQTFSFITLRRHWIWRIKNKSALSESSSPHLLKTPWDRSYSNRHHQSLHIIFGNWRLIPETYIPWGLKFFGPPEGCYPLDPSEDDLPDPPVGLSLPWHKCAVAASVSNFCLRAARAGRLFTLSITWGIQTQCCSHCRWTTSPSGKS